MRTRFETSPMVLLDTPLVDPQKKTVPHSAKKRHICVKAYRDPNPTRMLQGCNHGNQWDTERVLGCFTMDKSYFPAGTQFDA